MEYLIALFMPPVYFVMKGHWLHFFPNAIVYAASIVLVLTVAIAFLAPMLWLAAAAHAVWMLHHDMEAGNGGRTIAHRLADAIRDPDAGE